ncbi:hypothetical protein J2803_003696 [Paraburkholderia phenoliruptrix]|nr:hypothetical protein [Paraburkholderia phenoliruptrix]
MPFATAPFLGPWFCHAVIESGDSASDLPDV